MKLFVGAKALVVDPEGKVLIVRESTQYEEETEAGRWDVVGGRIEPNETLHDGLTREVREESGLTVTPGNILGVGENFVTIRDEQIHIVRIYYACNAQQQEVVLGKDHDQYAWIDPNAYATYDLMEDVAEIFEQYNQRNV